MRWWNFECRFRVHSINVLRSIFSDKRLSEAVQGRLERALRACLLGIASPYWPVRNAISQLFAVLLVRIFGVARTPQRTLRIHEKNAMSGYEFFSRSVVMFSLESGFHAICISLRIVEYYVRNKLHALEMIKYIYAWRRSISTIVM